MRVLLYISATIELDLEVAFHRTTLPVTTTISHCDATNQV